MYSMTAVAYVAYMQRTQQQSYYTLSFTYMQHTQQQSYYTLSFTYMQHTQQQSCHIPSQMHHGNTAHIPWISLSSSISTTHSALKVKLLFFSRAVTHTDKHSLFILQLHSPDTHTHTHTQAGHTQVTHMKTH